MLNRTNLDTTTRDYQRGKNSGIAFMESMCEHKLPGINVFPNDFYDNLEPTNYAVSLPINNNETLNRDQIRLILKWSDKIFNGGEQVTRALVGMEKFVLLPNANQKILSRARDDKILNRILIGLVTVLRDPARNRETRLNYQQILTNSPSRGSGETESKIIKSIIGSAELVGGLEFAFKVAQHFGLIDPEIHSLRQMKDSINTLSLINRRNPGDYFFRMLRYQPNNRNLFGQSLVINTTVSRVPGMVYPFTNRVDNGRLEWLGDMIYNMITIIYLVINNLFHTQFNNFGKSINIIKSNKVMALALSELRLSWHIISLRAPNAHLIITDRYWDDFLIDGHDLEFEKSYADVFEALIASIFIDLNFDLEATHAHILRLSNNIFQLELQRSTIPRDIRIVRREEHLRSHSSNEPNIQRGGQIRQRDPENEEDVGPATSRPRY